MSSSESSYTWDEWYNRNKQNGKKSGLIDKHQEAYIMKQQRDELLSALIGLLGDAEAIAQVIPAYGESQNLKNARAAIAKAGVNNG